MSEELTAEQVAHKQLMDEVNKAYGDGDALVASNPQLEKFITKLKERGFKLDPFKVVKLLDKEAEEQHQAIFDSFFKGHHTDTIAQAKDEVIKWYYEEESRFQKFKENYLKHPEAHLEESLPPVIDTNVVAIKNSTLADKVIAATEAKYKDMAAEIKKSKKK